MGEVRIPATRVSALSLGLHVLDDDGGVRTASEGETNDLTVTTPEALDELLACNATRSGGGEDGLGERFSEGVHGTRASGARRRFQ